MEIMSTKDAGEQQASFSTKCYENSLLVSCNWQITNNKQFRDAITTVPLLHAPARINYEDIVSVDTCISLQSTDSNIDSCTEPCMLDIKVTNCQKIARIAIVSEGNVLEIFKQFGEYETTIFAEFIDEYEGNTVFLGEATIQPPTTEASIKFTRTKSKGPMWIYGIRLFLTDSIQEAKPSAFNYDIIQTFLSNANGKASKGAEIARRVLECYDKHEIINNEQLCQKNLKTIASSSNYLGCKNEIGKRDNESDCLNCEDNYEKSNACECKNGIVRRNSEKECLNCGEAYKKLDIDIRTYIDNKCYYMEKRLMERIDEMEASTNQKLDTILERLEAQLNLK